jgi:hypothetical protein
MESHRYVTRRRLQKLALGAKKRAPQPGHRPPPAPGPGQVRVGRRSRRTRVRPATPAAGQLGRAGRGGPGPLESPCCSPFLMPTSSPEPFSGSGGHQVCGAGRRCLNVPGDICHGPSRPGSPSWPARTTRPRLAVNDAWGTSVRPAAAGARPQKRRAGRPGLQRSPCHARPRSRTSRPCAARHARRAALVNAPAPLPRVGGRAMFEEKGNG